MNPTPRFTGLFIPVEVLNNQELTMLEQMLLSWVDALYCPSHKGCYASNDYFAKKLKVKENTIAKAFTSLRQKGMIEDVSFDGRHRIVRAKLRDFIEKCQSNPELDLNPTPIGLKSNPELDKNPNPSYIRDKSIKQSLDTPIPHEISMENATKVAEKKFSKEIDPEIKELADALIQEIVKEKPNFAVPKNLNSLWTDLDLMLRLDKREPQKILDLLRWALADDFWRSHMFKPNIAKYLRSKFDQLEEKMITKPRQKERKFAASSDNARAKKIMDDFAKGAI